MNYEDFSKKHKLPTDARQLQAENACYMHTVTRREVGKDVVKIVTLSKDLSLKFSEMDVSTLFDFAKAIVNEAVEHQEQGKFFVLCNKPGRDRILVSHLKMEGVDYLHISKA